jgi:rhodanese-related sulfurtransferase
LADSLPSLLAPAELREWLAASSGLRILDVRTPGEFQSMHVAGAYNVPLDTLREHAREIREQVESDVVLVCQSGNRARRAEELLKIHGMGNVHVLSGGMNAWIGEGLDVVRGPSRISLERQVRMIAGALVAAGGALAVFANPLFGLVPFVVGSGLLFAGATDRCGMALLLAKLPYNRPATCDVPAAVRALVAGS